VDPPPPPGDPKLARTWRVVAVDPRSSSPAPRVLLSTAHLDLAMRTLELLRGAGKPVALVEEAPGGAPAWCAWHPLSLLAGTCRRCGRSTCSTCKAEAAGALLCPDCLQKSTRRARHLRLRQLLAILLFSFFLYELHLYFERDAARVDPRRTVRVVMTQFIAPGEEATPVVTALNRTPEESALSLRAIAPWYQAERARYTGRTDAALDIDLRGPWPQVVDPPEVDLSGPLRSAWTAWRYTRWFRAAAASHGVEVDPYAVKLYVIYVQGAEDLASHSRASEKSRFAVAWIDLSEPNPAYAQLTVAHELAHALGAEDLYEPGSFLARYPEGFVEPLREPLYPQPAAELMAADIPIGPGQEREVTGLHEVRIGAYTASTLGWISPEQALASYLKRPSGALQGPPLPAPAEAATDPATPAAPPAP
jgi:hypothetical protein